MYSKNGSCNSNGRFNCVKFSPVYACGSISFWYNSKQRLWFLSTYMLLDDKQIVLVKFLILQVLVWLFGWTSKRIGLLLCGLIMNYMWREQSKWLWKGPSPIFSTFSPTSGDFGVTRKLILFHNPCKISWLKSVAFGRCSWKSVWLW